MFGFGKKSGPEAGKHETAMSPEEAESLAQEIEDMESVETIDNDETPELDFEGDGMSEVA